jgi:hypothetical protein
MERELRLERKRSCITSSLACMELSRRKKGNKTKKMVSPGRIGSRVSNRLGRGEGETR